MPQRRIDPFQAVDLFCGCGGLTVGLKAAGLRVVAGVEVEAHAFATYKTNHPEVQVYHQDIRTVDAGSLLAHADGRIDVLAGCPPCQGFSSLTAKWRRSDPRDGLVAEMGRFVRGLRPRVVMMENVPGLAIKGWPILEELIRELEADGYIVNWDILQVADYGVPQRRRRLVLLAGRGFDVPLPAPTHCRTGESLPKWRSLRQAIAPQRRKPIVFSEAVARGGPALFDWHVVRSMSKQNQRRLAHAKPGGMWSNIPKRLRPDCHQGLLRATGFRNAYGRMSWDEPAVTITGGCTTLSKGRFGHPTQDRTISVREAATLQTFPRTYLFETPYIEYACEMIGNALPCAFAEAVARECVRALRAHRDEPGKRARTESPRAATIVPSRRRSSGTSGSLRSR
jgi:DNA (cytosine-5)-methyltransferase 1